MSRYAWIFLCLFFLAACEQQSTPRQADVTPPPLEPAAKVSAKTFTLMQDQITPHLFELPTEALQVWREYKENRPALVLFSIHPLLQPVNENMKEDVASLLAEGTAEDFYRHGSLNRSTPILTPIQTLSAALDAGCFSEIVWFFPTREELANFSAETFQARMSAAGFISESNPKLSLLEEGIIGGTLRGVPIRIIHPLAALPEITQPLILHLDLGYFKGLYKNGVSTPVYNLLEEVALLLRDSHYAALTATLSYSTEDAEFSIDTRFLIRHLAALLHNPAMLETDMPESWRVRKEALFSNEMYMENESKKLIAEAAAKFPDDPSFQHDYFQVLLQTGQNEAAFALLDKIVELDPGYAQEYLSLAETAVEKNWLTEAVNLLQKAEKHYPENPFIALRKADILIQLKDYPAALLIIENLKTLPWSQKVYPQVSETLIEMETFARNPPAEAKSLQE